MIEIKNLTKNFQKFTALNDVSLNFDNGHSIALIGPNGCGKTTARMNAPLLLLTHKHYTNEKTSGSNAKSMCRE